MTFHAIRMENVHYAYPPAIQSAPPVPALQGIDLAVETGTFLAVMGPIGAGKTTLCLALNGLVPQSTGGTFRGDVWVADHNTKRLPVAELSAAAGLVFQDAEGQLFNMTVEDEVAFGAENLGLPVEEIEHRIQWALDVVGLADLRARSPAQLSGGQQRRLAIAAVLAMRPAILVLDEPTAGLDPLGRRAVLAVIAELRHQGTTVVMATQDADAAVALADQVVVLEAGHVSLMGTSQEILGQVEQLAALGVDVPQMAELSQRLGIQPPWLTVDQAFRALSAPFGQSSYRAPAQAPADLSNSTADFSPADQSQLRGDHPEPRGRTISSPDGRIPTVLAGTSSPAQAVVGFEDVWYQYEEGAQALAGANLALSSGEFVALIGANGSGKTTLAKHVNGLLRPQRGRVLLAGGDTRGKSVGELARRVSYVFQNPDHQIFAPSVREEITFGPRNLGLDRAQVEKRVEAALAIFDLTSLADLPPATLGYGQRRLVTLASVHAMAPEVLILDEPAASLDRRLTTALIDWVSALCQAGATVVLITHDMRLASLAPRSVVMARGRVLLDVRTAELYPFPERTTQAGITPPPIVELGRRLGMPAATLNIAEFCQAFARSAGEVSAP
jgi:energy-coupling factor transport system ATP-binding protein